jgi:hypothetical protein
MIERSYQTWIASSTIMAGQTIPKRPRGQKRKNESLWAEIARREMMFADVSWHFDP